MNSWESHYYHCLVKEKVSLFIVFCIIVSHYVCCTHTLYVLYGSTYQISSNRSHLSNLHNLYTPLHPLILIQHAKNDSNSIKNTTLSEHNTTLANKTWVYALITVATTDPFSFIYDALTAKSDSSYIPLCHSKVGVESIECNADNDKTIEDEITRDTPKEQCEIISDQTTESLQVNAKHIFNMYFIVIISFISVWLPSIYVTFQNYSSLVWVNVMLTPIAVYITLIISLLIHSLVSQQLAICVAMHMSIRHIVALHTADLLAYNTPTPMKHIICGIYPLAVTTILFYISNASNTTLSNYNTSTFYMCHVWSILCCELIRVVPLNILLCAMLYGGDINDE
jgi:hypothetical protein